MKIQETPIKGLYTAESTIHFDQRGSFFRSFCDTDLADILNGKNICQSNVSMTSAVGAVRGMHFQKAPAAEMKLIRCLRGKVWDVAVDLRENSPTFLKWHAEELTPENGKLYILPEGCAHGFQVIEPNSELLYLHTAPYTPELEGGIRWDDPLVGINWPLQAIDLSQRDQKHNYLKTSFRGLSL